MKRAFAAFAFLLAVAFTADAFSEPSLPPATIVAGNGNVAFGVGPRNQIIGLTTRLFVPLKPAPVGTLFLWPGLQPGPEGANFRPINNGVLQPVLTWGKSCAPGQKPPAYDTWWISAQYVNTFGRRRGHRGCHGGPIMAVDPGDTLLIRMSLFKSVWRQTVLDLQSGKSVGFHISLRHQAQTNAWFEIEPAEGATIANDVVFAATMIDFATPNPQNCYLKYRGLDDVTKPILIDGGQSCYIDRITLRSATRSCGKEGEVQSGQGRDRTAITFKNNRGSPVRLYWIDETGHRKLYATIDDGQSHRQPTFLTHPWLLADQADTCIGLYLPVADPREIVIR
jgi:hypothetical protein